MQPVFSGGTLTVVAQSLLEEHALNKAKNQLPVLPWLVKKSRNHKGVGPVESVFLRAELKVKN